MHQKPLFVAAGMARLPPYYILPAFFVGKFTSDALAVIMGKYASENVADLLHGALSWKSIAAMALGLLLIAAILFVDWRTLIQHKKWKLNFRIFT